MALPPIQSTKPVTLPVHEFHVWIEIEEVDENGDHIEDKDWGGYGKLGTYPNLETAAARAEFVEWLVNNVKYVQSPDGLHSWAVTARL